MKTVELSIVSYRDLINSLSSEVQAEVDKVRQELEIDRIRRMPTSGWTLLEAYRWEVTQLIEHVQEAVKGQAVMGPFRQAGSQWIAEFWVNDLEKPRRDQYNWHLQNTSQWNYAGCILVQDGRVSTHH